MVVKGSEWTHGPPTQPKAASKTVSRWRLLLGRVLNERRNVNSSSALGSSVHVLIPIYCTLPKHPDIRRYFSFSSRTIGCQFTHVWTGVYLTQPISSKLRYFSIKLLSSLIVHTTTQVLTSLGGTHYRWPLPNTLPFIHHEASTQDFLTSETACKCK